MINQNSDGRWISLKQSRSLRWKIIHGINFMLGGVCLIIGSCMCFTEVNRRFSMAPTMSGLFFSFGSFFLLLADLQEWWYNRSYQDVYEVVNHNRRQHFRPLKRLAIISNSFGTACGSGLYLVGSILLIPTFENYAVVGAWLIILGSTTIFLCTSWKIWQSSRRHMTDPYNRQFHLVNILNDTSALFVDMCALFGGIFYFFGVMLILPSFSKDNLTIDISATLCVLGGSSFFLASIGLQYRYYCMKYS